MTEQERIKENLRKNKPFITAFDYLADMFANGSQKDLAVLIGTKSPRISEYRNGKYPVPDEVIDGLIRFSAFKKMQIYSGYLHGHSDIMLLANVPDEELAEAELRRNNPDYDILQQRLRNSERKLDTMLSQSLPPASSVDASSAINAAIAAKDETIGILKARIADLQRTIADKDTIIRDREDRIRTLERQLAAVATSDLSRYPFNMGAAEDNKRSTL